MKSHVGWYSSDCRVIYWVFDDGWTWDDYQESYAIVCILAQSVNYRVDVIAKLPAGGMLPMGAAKMYELTALGLPSNIRTIAVVGASIWAKAMIKGLRPISPRLGSKVFFADTVPEACRLLCVRDDLVMLPGGQKRHNGFACYY